ACFASGLTDLMSERLKSRQLQVLGLLRTADLFFIFRDRDVKSLEDMRGAKLRVTGGRIFLDMVRSFDASPVSMAASEMSTALAQGAIDGVLTSPAGWAEMIGKTGKYAFHVPGMSLATYAVVVDRAWMDALTPAQRKAVADSLNSIISRQWEEARAADDKLIKQMEKEGSVYRVADDAAAAEWQARADTAKKAYTDKYPEAVKQVDAIAKRCGVGNGCIDPVGSRAVAGARLPAGRPGRARAGRGGRRPGRRPGAGNRAARHAAGGCAIRPGAACAGACRVGGRAGAGRSGRIGQRGMGARQPGGNRAGRARPAGVGGSRRRGRAGRSAAARR